MPPSRVSSHFHHTGEELFYRGTEGSGTVFFTSCNMRCVFCQNGDISTADSTGRRNTLLILRGEEVWHHSIMHLSRLEIRRFGDRKLGAPIGVEVDHSDGKTLWIFERCGADTCVGSTLDPVMKFDANGKMVANFGGGLVNWPHGFYVDRAGDVWARMGAVKTGKAIRSSSSRRMAGY